MVYVHGCHMGAYWVAFLVSFLSLVWPRPPSLGLGLVFSLAMLKVSFLGMSKVSILAMCQKCQFLTFLTKSDTLGGWRTSLNTNNANNANNANMAKCATSGQTA